MENRDTIDTTENKDKSMKYEDLLEKLEAISIAFESYSDYPQAATNNAKRARKWKKENGSDCGHKDVPYSEGCGGIMWDAWGGSSGVNWAINKLKQIDKK
jgi:hypothetical protein